MVEIGVWITPSGPQAAILELDTPTDGVDAQELPSWMTGAVTGALQGAASGLAGGPWGALAGAAIGGVAGAASSASQPGTTPQPAAAVAQSADRAKVIQALQQFASMVPALVQIVAKSGKTGKEAALNGAPESFEGADGWDWSPESLEGTWTAP